MKPFLLLTTIMTKRVIVLMPNKMSLTPASAKLFMSLTLIKGLSVELLPELSFCETVNTDIT